MKDIRNVFAAVLLLGTTLFAFQIVYAQSSIGLEIQPAVIEDSVNPGDTYTFSLRVSNLSGDEKVLFLGAEDIKGVDDDGTPIFASEGEVTNYDISSWVDIPVSSVTVPAGGSKEVQYTIRVPSDATPGSHFGSIFFDSQPPQMEQTGAGVGVRIGSVVSLRISGETTEEMRLREFSTAAFIYDAPPVTFNTRLENLGNVLLRPNGLIEITDMLGKKIAIVEVNESGASVFPQSDRQYSTQWNHDGFTFGRYQAIASIVYGDDVRKTVSATTSFWVLPMKPILIVLGTLFGLILALYLFMKLYIRRKLNEMGVKGDSDYYARKYNRSASKLVFIAFAVFVLGVAGLVVLFLLFA